MRSRAFERVPWEHKSRPRQDELLQWFAEGVDLLVSAIADVSPSEPLWNRSTAPQTSAFWPRRMAYETAVNRWDAQASHGIEGSMEPVLAEDGIGEVIDMWLPSFLAEHPDVTVLGSMAVRCVDRPGVGSWRLMAEGSS